MMTKFKRLALAAAFGTAVATSALAHSSKETTSPADGSTVAQPPDAIVMTFDAPMRVTLIQVTGEDGTNYPVTRTDNMAPSKTFQAVPAALPDGSYTVNWRGLAEDGHAMNGSFTFSVGN